MSPLGDEHLAQRSPGRNGATQWAAEGCWEGGRAELGAQAGWAAETGLRAGDLLRTKPWASGSYPGLLGSVVLGAAPRPADLSLLTRGPRENATAGWRERP